jgi:hypothetical protein
MQAARQVSTEVQFPSPREAQRSGGGGVRGGGMQHDVTNNGLDHSVQIIERTKIE